MLDSIKRWAASTAVTTVTLPAWIVVALALLGVVVGIVWSL